MAASSVKIMAYSSVWGIVSFEAWSPCLSFVFFHLYKIVAISTEQHILSCGCLLLHSIYHHLDERSRGSALLVSVSALVVLQLPPLESEGSTAAPHPLLAFALLHFSGIHWWIAWCVHGGWLLSIIIWHGSNNVERMMAGSQATVCDPRRQCSLYFQAIQIRIIYKQVRLS